jgi:DNA invertase Pin-like site-specific DNA recombinase
MILTVFAGIAEFECSLIYQRISTEREAAKKRSVRFGRPFGWSRHQDGHR